MGKFNLAEMKAHAEKTYANLGTTLNNGEENYVVYFNKDKQAVFAKLERLDDNTLVGINTKKDEESVSYLHESDISLILMPSKSLVDARNKAGDEHRDEVKRKIGEAAKKIKEMIGGKDCVCGDENCNG